MKDNRLKGGSSITYGLDRLKSHCEELNALKWVRYSGKPYFIAERSDANGVVSHYIDRKGN